jgi:hypothetical protein
MTEQKPEQKLEKPPVMWIVIAFALVILLGIFAR